MENNTSRIIIETVVKKTLKDIKDSPQRSIRNLVDLALEFSTGRFHRIFFEIAQTMLKNQKSSYYRLIEDIANNVNSEKVLHFGMNLGYNGCTVGAKKIREIEKKEHFNIPWSVSFHLDSQQFNINQIYYQKIISQGEELGIYTWILLPGNQPQKILSLVQQHPNSAFILFCKPKEITQPFLDGLSGLNNLMLVIHYEDGVYDKCNFLRKKKLLYSVYYNYEDCRIESIVNGEIFEKAQLLHPVFTALYADSNYNDSVRNTVYEAVKKARNEQTFHTIAFEMTFDIRKIDQIISNDSCLVSFDSKGNLLPLKKQKTENCFNIFYTDLYNILKLAFPKSHKDKFDNETSFNKN